MPPPQCEIPIRIRLVGRPTDATMDRLDEAVARCVATQVTRAEAALDTSRGAAVRRAPRRTLDGAGQGGDGYVAYDVVIPQGLTSRDELDRYIETTIFGRPLDFVDFGWTASTPVEAAAMDDPAGHAGQAITFRVREADLAAFAMPRRAEAPTVAAEAYAEMGALPEAVASLLGGPANAAPDQVDVVRRLADKLSRLSAQELADYTASVTAATTDLHLLEASVDRYLATRAERAWAQVRRRDLAGKLTDPYWRYARLGRAAELLERFAEERAGDEAAALRAQAAELRRQETADLAAALTGSGFTGVEDLERALDAYERGFLAETVAITLDVLRRFEHELWVGEAHYAGDIAVQALVAAARSSSAPADLAEAAEKDTEAQQMLDEGGFKVAHLARGRWDAARDLRARARETLRTLPGQPLVADRTFPHLELVTGDPASVRAAVAGYVRDRRADVERARGYLADDPKIVYTLPSVMAMSLAAQAIEPGSAPHALITARQRAHTGQKLVTDFVLGVVAVALTLAAPHVGPVAAAAALGANAGLGIASVARELDRHAVSSTFAGVGLADEQNVGWVIAAMIGAGLDLGSAVAAIAAVPGLRQAIVAVNRSSDLTALRQQLVHLPERVRRSVLLAAAAKLRSDAAVATAMSRPLAFGGAVDVRDVAVVVHRLVKRGAATFELVRTDKQLAGLIRDGMLTEENARRLVVEADRLVTELRDFGRPLKLTDDEVGDFVEHLARNPAVTVEEVKTAMTRAARKEPLDAAAMLAADAKKRAVAADTAGAAEFMAGQDAAAKDFAAELAELQLLRPAKPAGLTNRLNDIHTATKARGLAAELDAVRRLRAGTGVTAEQREYLDWYVWRLELLVEQQQARASAVAADREAGRLQTAATAAQEEFASASRSLYDLLRKPGVNYRTKRAAISHDEVMGEIAWKALSEPERQRSKIKGVMFHPDHLVSVDELATWPEFQPMVELYQRVETSPLIAAADRAGFKEVMVGRLRDELAEMSGNLVGMRANANVSKNNRSWAQLSYEWASEYGYDVPMVNAMRRKELVVRADLMKKLDAMVREYRLKILGQAGP